MEFIVRSKEYKNKSNIVLHTDSSFGYRTLIENWNFQICLKPFDNIYINVDLNTGKIVSVEGYLISKGVKKTKIDVFNYVEGSIFIDPIPFIDLEGVSYHMKNNTALYDVDRKIIGFGDVVNNDNTPYIMFGDGQFAKINSKGELLTLIIKF